MFVVGDVCAIYVFSQLLRQVQDATTQGQFFIQLVLVWIQSFPFS